MFLQRLKAAIIQVRNLLYHSIPGVIITLYFGVTAFILSSDIFLEQGKYSQLYEHYQEQINRGFYLWDKTLHVFLFLALYRSLKSFRLFFKLALIYSTSSLCYEIIRNFRQDKVAEATGVHILFLILASILGFLSFVQFIKDLTQWRSKL